jgi:curli production assembly/transport component CsgF
MKKLRIAFLLLPFLFQVHVLSQDLVYTPKNPAFGGNPYNYSWMLASAEAQNPFVEEEEAFSLFDDDPLADFQESLNRQILNEITRQLYFNQFGEGGLQEGFYEFGTFQIDISATAEGMQIRIIDISTGSETTVIVPYY